MQAAADTMAAIGVKDPADPGAICGPVISAAQRDRVASYLDLAVAEGGRFATGGHVIEQDGFWIEPTVIADLDNTSRLAQEEIFGPVLVVIAHDGDDDAVRIANESPYGLSGSVDSGDLERAKAVAARIRTGTIAVNGGVWFSPDAPGDWNPTATGTLTVYVQPNPEAAGTIHVSAKNSSGVVISGSLAVVCHGPAGVTLAQTPAHGSP